MGKFWGDTIPTASTFLRLTVRNPNLKLQSLLSEARVKLRTANLADIYSPGPSEQKPVRNLGEKGEWTYPGTAQFFVYPLLSREGVKLRTSNLAGTFTIKQKPMKKLGGKGALTYPWTAQIFWVAPIISGTGEATNFKFGGYKCSLKYTYLLPSTAYRLFKERFRLIPKSSTLDDLDSRSSKVYDFGISRKRICDFLLVLLVAHCNHGPILHRFWDTATYCLKIGYFSYLSLIRRRTFYIPSEFRAEVKREKTRVMRSYPVNSARLWIF